MKKTYLFLALLFGYFSASNAQTNNIILGRPTDTTITASVMFDQSAQFYLQYGTVSGNYTNTTPVTNAVANTPDEIELKNLLPNTRYYYKMQYKLPSATNYTATTEYNFITKRSAGSSFVFTVEADEHLYDIKGVKSLYQLTLNQEAAAKPDFMLSLGDIFGDDHYPFTITSGELDTLHRDYRPFLGSICHSIPFYVCLGNHEGEMDYYYNLNAGNNLCVMGTKWRKHYYPNPYPNAFYSGNTNYEPYNIGYPENYYAWKWGDALFVVLDAYRDQCDTSAKPTNWNWTLGYPQYSWLKTTLETNTAKYKFVFAHHIRGQGRGGIEEAKLFEWGGVQGANGNNTFAVNRPGWSKPIHQLFKDNGVTIFFQGHDHLFAKEDLDGVVYQEVPMPSDSTYNLGYIANGAAYVTNAMNGSGHIRVTVNPNCVKVDYVKSYLPADTLSGIHHNGEIGYTYTLGNCLVTDVNEIKPNENIKIYPNPVSDKLYCETNVSEQIKNIFLFNGLGECVKQTTNKIINVSELINGLYIVKVLTNKGSSTKKIMVSH